jgi:hypothetical protein
VGNGRLETSASSLMATTSSTTHTSTHSKTRFGDPLMRMSSKSLGAKLLMGMKGTLPGLTTHYSRIVLPIGRRPCQWRKKKCGGYLMRLGFSPAHAPTALFYGWQTWCKVENSAYIPHLFTFHHEPIVQSEVPSIYGRKSDGRPWLASSGWL